MSTISVVIPISSNSEGLPILSFLKDVDYPKDKMEIILSIGKWPSIQRNRAAEIARGDILYFFNRDAQFNPNIFKEMVSTINCDKKIAGAGGPDLTPEDNSCLQHLFGYAMSSYFAHGKMRARYSKVGKKRFTDEKELVLSNIAIRRDIFLRSNGFSEKLYPNEENELINRISKKGYKFIYNPDLRIYRDRKNKFSEFIKQFYRYGHGRMRQILIEGVWRNLQFFMPVLLLVYFLILPFVWKFWISFVPLVIYIIFGIVDAIYFSYKNKRVFILLPIIYIMMHLSYGVGMCSKILFRFIFKQKKAYWEDITIKHIKRFEDS